MIPRPTFLLRYILPAVAIILCLFYLSNSDTILPSVDVAPPAQGTKMGEKPVEIPPSNGHTDHVVETKPEDTVKTSPPPADKPASNEPPVHNTPANGSPADTTPPAAPNTPPTSSDKSSLKWKPAEFATGDHPIDARIQAAEKEFNDRLAKRTYTLADAAAAYRERRGRHPPPGFDKWFEFAKEKDAIIVEDFWDQIYHDLEPFWALKPARIRHDAYDFEMRISVRDGKASSGSDWFWTKIWLNLIKTIEHLVPDLDIALNAMDEPRMVVPWEKINEFMTAADKTRTIKDAATVVQKYPKLPGADVNPDANEVTPKKTWENKSGIPSYWAIARRGCPPDSLARTSSLMTDFDRRPTISNNFAAAHTEKGYVSNYTLSTLVCHQPDLQGLNGIFVEPLSVSATDTLFPMFGGSKLAVNNEILLPAPMYWNEEERFMGDAGADVPWAEKKDGVIWRGVATGGKNRETNWRAFQRHRFVAMNNATKLERAVSWTELPENFDLPPSEYGLKAQQDGKLGDWVKGWSNVSFVDLFCTPKPEKGLGCNYTDPHYTVTAGMKMADQFYYKYLPDIDGNSFSGRYLGFLRSTSLPIKATVWREWHDSRLTAWKHFVPMDNRYSDWFGIMEYFVGYGDKVKGHDQVAEAIAMAGKEWADKALRKEDMQVYVLRLLLEYARLSADDREVMGWVGDLIAKTAAPAAGSGQQQTAAEETLDIDA
ncbi:hypothetical protein B0T20DRAFT_85046 [Sordaria brevicollis]|uniref:Glycosyl transferase CAP10 domain-containing protein n=1 Tax=Sordaria brevicollis TaxID=83679 RepID=A0AAE0U5T0_SORBR|nr:hypothetical protein B0T20DRAFT_85046 [Sordaria brevicollis]